METMFFTVYCLLSVLPSHNACAELTLPTHPPFLHTYISSLFCWRLIFYRFHCETCAYKHACALVISEACSSVCEVHCWAKCAIVCMFVYFLRWILYRKTLSTVCALVCSLAVFVQVKANSTGETSHTLTDEREKVEIVHQCKPQWLTESGISAQDI